MSRFLDNLLDMKHRVKKYVEPIQEQWTEWADEIDSASPSKVEDEEIRQIPRISTSFCARVRSNREICGICSKLCPTNAISFVRNEPHISGDCISCGICSAVCPTDAIISYEHSSINIFDKIGRSSSLFNTSYITCERAKPNIKADNIYVVPCLADISRAEWTFIMNAYDNVSLYIPQGLCESCEVRYGEALYRTQIYEAEKAGMYPLGLTRDAEEIDTRLKPYLEREELAVSVSNNHLEEIQKRKALEKIEIQKRAFRDVGDTIIDSLGRVSIQGQMRRLTTSKKFDFLSTLLNDKAKDSIPSKIPHVNAELCSGCASCANACPQGACEIDRRGNFHLADRLCVGCGACVGVCEESALVLIREHF